MELLNRVSSYEFPNMVLPGVLMSSLLCRVLGLDFALIGSIPGIIIFLSVSYTLGLFASKFGSVIIEPIAKSCGVVQRASYEDFCLAENLDKKIAMLAQYRDLYRTFMVVGLYSLVLSIYGTTNNPSNLDVFLIGLSSLFIVVFFLAYGKQSMYVTKRIDLVKTHGNELKLKDEE